MRAKGKAAKPVCLEFTRQIWAYEGRLGQLPQPLLMLGNGLDVADRRIVPKQSVRLFPHRFGHGLAGGEFSQERAGLQHVAGAFGGHGHAGSYRTKEYLAYRLLRMLWIKRSGHLLLIEICNIINYLLRITFLMSSGGTHAN